MGKFKVGDRVVPLPDKAHWVNSHWREHFEQIEGSLSECVVVGYIGTDSPQISNKDGGRGPYWSDAFFELAEWDFDPRKAGNDNVLKIEAGKFYRTRDGRKVGPAKPNNYGVFQETHPWRMDEFDMTHRPDGGFMCEGDDESKHDLIAEWVDEPKFKEGDRVRWTKGTVHWQDVILTERHESPDVWLGRCAKLGIGGFPEGELELLPAATPEPIHTPHIVAVFRNGHPAPNQRPFVHGSEEAATAEAERLASLHPSQEFGVFALVAKRVGEVTVRAA